MVALHDGRHFLPHTHRAARGSVTALNSLSGESDVEVLSIKRCGFPNLSDSPDASKRRIPAQSNACHTLEDF